MGALEGLGRSNFNQNLGIALEDLRSRRQEALEGRRLDLMESQEQRLSERSGLLNELTETELQRRRNMLQQQEEERKIAEQPLAVEPLWDNFVGGREGDIAKYVSSVANSLGYVTDDGTMKRKYAMDLMDNVLAQPQHAQKLANLRVGIALKNYNQVTKAINDPEYRKEYLKQAGIKEDQLKEMHQQAAVQLNAAKGANKALMEALSQQAEQMRAEAAAVGAEASLTNANKEKTESYDKNLLVAAQIAGVSPQKVKSGQLTQEEAIKVAKAYSERFGSESLVKMILSGGGVGGATQTEPVIEFDENGNPK